jgi:hypothetical protein
MKSYSSKIALLICLVLALALSACGAGTPPATPTAADTNTPLPTNTPVPPTATPTATLTPTVTPRPTRTPDIAATQKHDSLLAWVERLAAEKIIPSVEGKYHPLDDFSDSYARIRSYAWFTYDDLLVSNFIIQAKVKIDNATLEGAYKSGCGFVMQNFFDNHAVFFSLDGNANYWSNGYDRGSNYLDNTLYEQNRDGLTLTMVLSNKALLFYVNDRKALSGITIYGEPFQIGPAILSGTSEGFGTRCDFTEMALWEVK